MLHFSAHNSHNTTVISKEGDEEGWLTMDQIAAKAGLHHYVNNPSQKDLLDHIIEGLPQSLHKGLGGLPRATSSVRTPWSP